MIKRCAVRDSYICFVCACNETEMKVSRGTLKKLQDYKVFVYHPLYCIFEDVQMVEQLLKNGKCKILAVFLGFIIRPG